MKKKINKFPYLLFMIGLMYSITFKYSYNLKENDYITLYIFPVERNYHILEGWLEPEIIHFVPFNPYEIDRHSERIKWASKAFYNEASKRGLNISHPIEKYFFSMREPKVKGIKKLGGYCYKDNNIIFLQFDFHESTFFHELGHCELNYAHPYNHSFLKKGYSSDIMHWGFRRSEYIFNKEEVLDHFFNSNNYHKLGTFVGQFTHHLMVGDIEYKRNKNKNKK